MKPRIYRYVVRYDGGTAPNPFGGWCTLAICKPGIRRGAEKGDWIIGFRSRRNDEVIYAMQIEHVVPLASYWRDQRFRSKRPDRTSLPDNIYRADANGELHWEPNDIHGPEAKPKDTSGLNALVSKRFWYFGRESPPIPTDLAHLIHSGQNYAVHKARRKDDIENLLVWLAHWPPGINGGPVDRPDVSVAARTHRINPPCRKGSRNRGC